MRHTALADMAGSFDTPASVPAQMMTRDEMLDSLVAGRHEHIIHDDYLNPQVLQAAQALITMDDKGIKTDLSFGGTPSDVLASLSSALMDLRIPHAQAGALTRALGEYVGGIGFSFAQKAGAKPLYLRLMVTDKPPQDMPDCEVYTLSMLDGARAAGSDFSQMVMQSTIFGTRSSMTIQNDLYQYFQSGKKKWVLVYFGAHKIGDTKQINQNLTAAAAVGATSIGADVGAVAGGGVEGANVVGTHVADGAAITGRSAEVSVPASASPGIDTALSSSVAPVSVAPISVEVSTPGVPTISGEAPAVMALAESGSQVVPSVLDASPAGDSVSITQAGVSSLDVSTAASPESNITPSETQVSQSPVAEARVSPVTSDSIQTLPVSSVEASAPVVAASVSPTHGTTPAVSEQGQPAVSVSVTNLAVQTPVSSAEASAPVASSQAILSSAPQVSQTPAVTSAPVTSAPVTSSPATSTPMASMPVASSTVMSGNSGASVVVPSAVQTGLPTVIPPFMAAANNNAPMVPSAPALSAVSAVPTSPAANVVVPAVQVQPVQVQPIQAQPAQVQPTQSVPVQPAMTQPIQVASISPQPVTQASVSPQTPPAPAGSQPAVNVPSVASQPSAPMTPPQAANVNAPVALVVSNKDTPPPAPPRPIETVRVTAPPPVLVNPAPVLTQLPTQAPVTSSSPPVAMTPRAPETNVPPVMKDNLRPDQPRTEVIRDTQRIETPRTEVSRTEPSRSDAPRTDTVRTENVRSEIPRMERAYVAGQEDVRMPTSPETVRNLPDSQVKAHPDWLKDTKTPEIKSEFKKCCEGGDCNACPLGKENKVDAKKIVASVNLNNKL